MLRTNQIQQRFGKLLLTLSLNYSIAIAVGMIVCMLLSVIRKYALPSFEPMQNDFGSMFFFRLLIPIVYLTMYFIANKNKSIKLIIVLINVLPIITFEGIAISFSYPIAYINFLLNFNNLKEILLLCLDTKTSYLSESLIMLYHLVRAVVFKFMNKDYSMFDFLQMFCVYAITHYQIVHNYCIIRRIISECDLLKSDLASVISSLPIPVFRFNLSKNISLCNDEFVKLIHTMEFPTNSEFASFFFGQDYMQNFDPFKSEDTFTIFYLTKSYIVHFRRLKQDDGLFYIASIEDHTLLKEYESLKIKQTYKRMFISVVNHQLRTPLNGAYFPLCSIREKCKDEEQLKLIDVALSSLELLCSLITDITTFNDCENNRLEIKYDTTNFAEELCKLRKIFLIDTQIKEIVFNLEINASHTYITTDFNRIKQILIILISNAFKYTAKGTVSLQCYELPHLLKIVVSDTGVGISEKEIPYIFNEFDRADEVNHQKKTSSGFQLSLVKKLVTLMGGTIEVESKEGQGAKFTIQLKVVWSSEEKLTMLSCPESMMEIKLSPPSADIITTVSTNTLKNTRNISIDSEILIVDDNAANIFVIERMLKQLSIKTDKALNGLECITKVTGRGMKGYKLILMDINMPVMNGIEASRSINTLIEEQKIVYTPIIALTAQCDAGMVDQCKQVGIKECHFKPIKFEELKSVVNEYID